ncbi:MAG TPA: hypothetical protein DCL13_06885, partial [Peptococcaceae bacterium]|nr:hypothetical protein [Peptococcaceae bacterium]
MSPSRQTGSPPLPPDPIYRTVFENTGTAMCVIEEDDIISLCNEEFARLAGLPREEIEGRKGWSEFVAPADLPRMLRYREARLSQSPAAPRHYEFRLVDRHGKTRNIWLTVTRIPETKRTLASLIDITERKRKEEALRLAEADYRAIFEAANDAIFVHDPKTGQILDVNPKMT